MVHTWQVSRQHSFYLTVPICRALFNSLIENMLRVCYIDKGAEEGANADSKAPGQQNPKPAIKKQEHTLFQLSYGSGSGWSRGYAQFGVPRGGWGVVGCCPAGASRPLATGCFV